MTDTEKSTVADIVDALMKGADAMVDIISVLTTRHTPFEEAPDEIVDEVTILMDSIREDLNRHCPVEERVSSMMMNLIHRAGKDMQQDHQEEEKDFEPLFDRMNGLKRRMC